MQVWDERALDMIAPVAFPSEHGRIEDLRARDQLPSGQEVPDWAPLETAQDLRYGLAPLAASREGREPDMTVVTRRRQVRLEGAYPEITTEMRFIERNGTVWDILAVHTDSLGMMTELTVELVTATAP